MDNNNSNTASASPKASSSFSRNYNRNSMPQISKLASTIFTLLLLTTTCSAFVSRNGLGVLKMCPPGGEAFATAWQMTCGMRKKRSGGFGDENESSASSLKLLPDSPTASPLDDLVAEDVTEMENPLTKQKQQRNRRSSESATNKFRPLRLTEMMHFCCRYGCSFRDLLPYCDPFGQWDS